jgi:hypothetical protein
VTEAVAGVAQTPISFRRFRSSQVCSRQLYRIDFAPGGSKTLQSRLVEWENKANDRAKSVGEQTYRKIQKNMTKSMHNQVQSRRKTKNLKIKGAYCRIKSNAKAAARI